MNTLFLARLQFGLTVMFHFLFPPISIGLAFLIGLIETARWKTGRALYARMSDFWLKIFAVNFAVGVATGIVMEFEFGTNWAGYSRFVGDIFGAPLAAEGIFAFFLESGFLGLLLLGRTRISSAVRWFATMMVALGTTLSAFWILVANSWMQTPSGFRIERGRAVLTSFSAAVFSPSMWPRFFHTMMSSYAAAAFSMIAVAAGYLLIGRHEEFAKASLRLGLWTAAASTLLVVLTGDRHARQVARTQPAKFAAMEGLYASTPAAPMILFSLPPRQEAPRQGPEIVVTNLTSLLAFGNFQAPVTGLDAFPKVDWPPVAATFLSFHNMVIVGNLMLLEILAGLYLLWRRRLDGSRGWLRVMVWSFPLPFLAIQLGWFAAEVGRQPWIVYGVLRTRDAVSRVVTAPAIVFSIALFSVVYAVLAFLWIWLLRKEIVAGPHEMATEVS